MFGCVICHFDVELDDVVVRQGDKCICLRCLMHEAGTEQVFDKAMRRDIEAHLRTVAA